MNRLFDGKEYGLILDYSGVIEDLDEAIDFYAQLADFDESDLAETVHYLEEATAKLPQYHSNIWELFPGMKGTTDAEAFAQSLRDEEKRNRFYERFNLFSRTLSMALASTNFLENTPEKTIRRYKQDLKSLPTFERRSRSASRSASTFPNTNPRSRSCSIRTWVPVKS